MVTRVAVTNNAPASAAAYTLALPSGYQAGDRLIAFVAGKYDTATIPTINQGWTLLKSGTGGTGSAGNDTGTTFWAVFGKDATSASETAPTITPGGTAPNSWESFTVAYRPSMGAIWADAIGTSATYVQSATDTNTASNVLTGTCGAFTNQPTAGDAIAAFGVAPTDLGSALGSTTITATGLSGGTVTTTSGYVENGLGQDTCSVFADWTGFTGTASAGAALSFTITGASNGSGSVVAVALRETVDPDSVQYVSSSRSGQSDANAATNTCPVPSGAASGMVALLAIEVFLDSGSAPITPTWPTGFTGIVDEQATPSGGVQLLIAKKTLTGSDSGNYVTSWSGNRWNMSMCVLLDNADAVNTPDTDSVKNGSGTSITSLSDSSVGKPALLHFQANSSSGSHTPPTNFTELQEGDYLTVAARIPLTTGSHSTSGAAQATSTVWAAALILVEPPSSGVTGTATGDFGFSAPATGGKIVTGATGQGSLGFSGPAVGGKIVGGTITSNLGFSAPASGAPVKFGTATGDFGFTAPANGTDSSEILGTATGDFGFTAPASGGRTVVGSTAVDLGFAAPAIGIPIKVGTIDTNLGFSAPAAGTVVGTVNGTATGDFGFSAPASGTPIKTGTATGDLGFSAPASGVPVKTGTATGAFGFNAPANGTVVGTVNGTATGAFGFSAPASGVPVKVGTATGDFGFSAPASGVPIKIGVVATNLGFTAPASGAPIPPVTGTATGSFGFTAPADGTIPTPGLVFGTATGAFGFSAPASGVPVKVGAAVSDLGFSAPANGVPVKLGTTAVNLGFAAPASGVVLVPVLGNASGDFGFGAPAAGVPVKLGSSLVALGFNASAIGSNLEIPRVFNATLDVRANGSTLIVKANLATLNVGD